MTAEAIDQLRLNFDRGSLLALNAVIGLMMYGMALDIRLADFKRVLKAPKGPIIGLVAQFVLLPAATFALTLILPVSPSMALGMILVAACPGGNLSNVVTYLASGNTALSVSMTAVSTAAAIFLTPLNLGLWGSLNPATVPILEVVRLDPLDVLGTIGLILGIPLILGILTARAYPALADKIRKPFKIGSVAVFIGFLILALGANWDNFLAAIGLVALGVAIHNATALGLGYLSALALGCRSADRRAVSIEVGIQNSALALVLIFDYFDGLGGMAVIAAWWGIWHIVSGLTVAGIWSRIPTAAREEAV